MTAHIFKIELTESSSSLLTTNRTNTDAADLRPYPD